MRRIARISATGFLAVAMLIVAASAAFAISASATLTAGSLAFVSAPGNVTFPSTALTGADQTVSSSAQGLDVGDATGSGTGWNITATSTTFTTGTHTLSTTATTVTSAPADSCDAGSTCQAATNSISFPYTLPAAATAPVATKLYNAAANTGMGNQTVSTTWKLAVPASAYSGTYTSTWTISLVSGP